MTKASLYQQLKQDIRQGLWPAGAVLNQQKLSEYYQVSRIPVRDALQQLKAEALLVMAGALAAVVSSDIASAQAWPSRNVTAIVPFAAGSAGDAVMLPLPAVYCLIGTRLSKVTSSWMPANSGAACS